MTVDRHILVVMYEINGSPARQALFSKEIKKSGAWWHHIKTSWILISNEGADECAARLSAHLDPADKLLVLEVSPVAAQGLLSERAWTWLVRNLDI